ncbi:MAG: hypothetical protein IJ527_07995 [Prevotella sp.]|nr:hypothetical protein [Prevotella sp.]
MKALSAVLASIYVILIILLLLSNCHGCEHRATDNTPRMDTIVQTRIDTVVQTRVDTVVRVDTVREQPQPQPQPQPRQDDAVRQAEQVGNNGQLKITLLWDFLADIDLHVLQPNGNEIWFRNLKDVSTGAQLDRDNKNGGQGAAENIYWQNPPRGAYKVALKYYGKSMSTGKLESGVCTVVVFQAGKQPKTYKVNMSQKGQIEQICTINL